MSVDDMFRQKVWSYYNSRKRSMPWRENHDFYSVFVSEIMLQQTQVARVVPKYTQFMERFPTIQSLTEASLADVLIVWQGLGYNRRAKFLHQAAIRYIEGNIPMTVEGLAELPGIGKNTAAAICAYVSNAPVVFIETNIRTVYLYEFFRDRNDVGDKEILAIVSRTLDRQNPREWYWALMDYGSYLKSQQLGSIKNSSTYVKQSRFQGSIRQARGDVLRRLVEGPLDRHELESIDKRYAIAMKSLAADGLIEFHGDIVCLTAHAE